MCESREGGGGEGEGGGEGGEEEGEEEGEGEGGREGEREREQGMNIRGSIDISLCLYVLGYVNGILLLTLQCCFEFRSRWILWDCNISQRHSINLHVQYREVKCSLNTHRN